MTASLALVMAAGLGTRMRSELPKVLHPVCGRPMVAWPVLAAREAGISRIAAIASPGRDLSSGLPEGVEVVLQPESDGTGGAVRAAATLIEEIAGAGDGGQADPTVLVLSGDGPLILPETIEALLAGHRAAGAAATVLTAELDEPGSYGRVIRGTDGSFERIVEAKSPGDATPEQLRIREVNTGVYAFAAAPLLAALGRITKDNAQGEYYLPDVLAEVLAAGGAVAAEVSTDPGVMLGVNDRADLAVVEAAARRRILEGHMRNGVTCVDPGSTWVDADVAIEPDVTLLPGTMLRGSTRVGAGSVLGPHSTLIDATVRPGVEAPHSYLVGCEVGEGCRVGPFAYLRPGTRMAAGAKAGTFVELKNSELGPGAKVPHLAYIGDAEVGAGANLGAGTITANYDGFRKHRTRVGEKARLGVDTMLIAPVEIGAGAYTGGGSVISKDVPAGALGISRPTQRNIDDYAERKAESSKEEDGDP